MKDTFNVGDLVAWAWYIGSYNKKPQISCGKVVGISKNGNPIVKVNGSSNPYHEAGKTRVVRTSSIMHV